MAEYIERAAAIKRIKEYSLTAYDINLDNKEEFAGNSLPENYCEGLYEATELLDDLPAAEVAEVRYGKWDASDRYKFLDGSTCIRCTECGAALHLDEYQKYNWHYCPNCGARMDKEDEHEAG